MYGLKNYCSTDNSQNSESLNIDYRTSSLIMSQIFWFFLCKYLVRSYLHAFRSLHMNMFILFAEYAGLAVNSVE
jgi:hypothetical protein